MNWIVKRTSLSTVGQNKLNSCVFFMYLSFFFGMKGKTNKNVYFVYQKIYIFYATRLKLSHIASSKKDVHFEITYIEDRSKLMTSGRGHFELTNFTKMDFVFCN